MSTEETSEPKVASAYPNLKPFQPGQSGNPAGRPRKKSKGEMLGAELTDDDLKAIFKKVVDAAKGGDLQAVRTVLDRVWAPLRAVDPPAYLEPLSGTLTAQGHAILAAMTEGDLSPGQAAQLLGALASQAKLVETDDFAKRLEAIEKRLGANGRAQL